jgi:hypothetical protein
MRVFFKIVLQIYNAFSIKQYPTPQNVDKWIYYVDKVQV